MEHFAQILLLLAVAIGVVVAFQHLRIPTSLGYLLVGVILGPHTVGPTVSVPEFQTIAEFGVVFLLFTIGLNFSLPRLYALRHQVLGLGTGQVVATTLLVGLVVWLAGLPAFRPPWPSCSAPCSLSHPRPSLPACSANRGWKTASTGRWDWRCRSFRMSWRFRSS